MLDIVLRTSHPAGYGSPPPSYTDAIADLPPEYSALPPVAEVRDLAQDGAAPAKPAQTNRRKESDLVQKPTPDISKDFEAPSGVRERKKKKPTAKKPAQSNKGASSDNGGEKKGGEDARDAGDAAQGGDGATGGNDGNGEGGGGDGGGGDDEWGGWNVGSSKKKNKKKQKEEEEERKRKEEEERAAKEEEERSRAEETTTTAGTSDNLSWADDIAEANADDPWASTTTIKRKDEKGKVRHSVFFPGMDFINC